MQRAQTGQLKHTQGCYFFRLGGDGPHTQMMIDFIDDNIHQYRVELTCRVLPIAQSTYYHAKDLSKNPEKRSLRSQHDDFHIIEIKRIWQDSKYHYDVGKFWQQMKADGMKFARCTIERLMILNWPLLNGWTALTKKMTAQHLLVMCCPLNLKSGIIII